MSRFLPCNCVLVALLRWLPGCPSLYLCPCCPALPCWSTAGLRYWYLQEILKMGEISSICNTGVASTPDIPGFLDQDPKPPRNCQRSQLPIKKAMCWQCNKNSHVFSAESSMCLLWLRVGFLLSTLGKQVTLSIFSFPVSLLMNHPSNEKIHPGEVLALLKVWFKEDTG